MCNYKLDQDFLKKNSNESLLYLFTVNINKCGRNCNTIDNPYSRVRVPNKINNMNDKVYNLMSGVNEARCLVQYELCE